MSGGLQNEPKKAAVQSRASDKIVNGSGRILDIPEGIFRKKIESECKNFQAFSLTNPWLNKKFQNIHKSLCKCIKKSLRHF